MTRVYLPDRRFLTVRGADAEDFLQGLITTDLPAVTRERVSAGALLTPQGKILFDFLISRLADGFRLETATLQADALLKRLTMYKLRAAVTLELANPAGVTVVFDEALPEAGLADGRFERAGFAVYRLQGEDNATAEASAYDALRIKAGVAESGADYALSDAFPHDVLLDLNGGLSFRKGCYVGQEVVSRMQHRSTARRRVVQVSANTPLPASGTDILAAGKVIGSLGTVVGRQALAIVRIDRAGEARAQGAAIEAGGVAVELSLPVWSGLDFPAQADEVAP